MLKFNSKIKHLANMPDFNQNIVKNEPMFFNASPAFAYEHGGPITKAFLELTGMLDEPCVIDTRVHIFV